MNKSRLVLTLKSFTPEELKRLGEFLNSPYFNKSKTLVKFYMELKKGYPDFSEEKITKEILYRKLFGEKEYNEQVMKNLISDLNRLCRDFLTVEITRADSFENRLNFLRQMIMRKTDPVFFSELKNFETELKKTSEISERNFYYLYQLEEAKISFHLERNQQPLVFDKVLRSGEYLILFFLLHLTKTISNLNVNKQSFNAIYETNLPDVFFSNIQMEKVIDYMKENKIEYSYLAELYYYRVICNTHPFDEEYYFRFKKLLMESLEKLSRIEVYGLFNALETFCMRKINTGEIKFINELFEIFSKEIDNGFYKYSETSPVTTMKFRNTYLSALTLKKFEWVENFIEQFSKDLVQPDRDAIIRIARAQIEFERGNFEKVLEGLADVSSDLFYLKIDIRNLTLMSYYELNYTESVLSGIDSYRHFLMGNRSLTDVFRESHLRFINALGSLIQIKEKRKAEKLDELILKLNPYRTERRIRWLIEKIEDELRGES
ncbi:MAG: hypothetical protein K1X85_08145 [Ignavibacteria bacterium]|nr:hypothetical protein [Ignavibacteria bacterium]